MEITDFLDYVMETLRSSGINESAVQPLVFAIAFSGVLGGLIGYFIRRIRFRRRQFFDQMVLGVNIFSPKQDGRVALQLRTLVENNLSALLDNPVLERLLVRAARRCTVDQPILRLKNAEDHALLLTKIQNAISAIFAGDHMLRLLGAKRESKWAHFVVTCERYGGLKATKIRVLIFLKEDIEHLLSDAYLAKIDVEARHHTDRIRTLRLIAQNHLQDDDVVRGKAEIPFPP